MATPSRQTQRGSLFSAATATPRAAAEIESGAAVREPGYLEDGGDPWAYPREGFCLVVLSDGRAHPAWLCRAVGPPGARRRFVRYGGDGGARALAPSERVDPLPRDDVALAARLQNDWAGASSAERDGLLRACDELEARRAAPPPFLAMLRRVRAAVAGGPAAAWGPSPCAGREFYPNLFSPLVGDAVRVLWDGDSWYEAQATAPAPPAGVRQGPAPPADAGGAPALACPSFYGGPRDPAARLHVRYTDDGTRDALPWPDPDGEAFLVAPPARSGNKLDKHRRRTANRQRGFPPPRDWRPLLVKVDRSRNAPFEVAPADAPAFLRDRAAAAYDTVAAAARPGAARAAPAPAPARRAREVSGYAPPAGAATRAWAETLAARRAEATAAARPAPAPGASAAPSPAEAAVRGVRAALGDVATPLAALLEDFADETPIPRESDDPDAAADWPWAWDRGAGSAPCAALFALADALAPAAAAAAAAAAARVDSGAAAGAAADARAAEEACYRSFSSGAAPPQRPLDKARVAEAAARVALSWDASAAAFAFGPKSDGEAAAAPCFALLPRTRVPEPHRSWLRRARAAASACLDRAGKKAVSPSSSEADSPAKKKARKPSAKQKREAAEAWRRDAEAAAFAARTPRPYRPPGAAARAALCGDRGVLLMETLAAPVTACLGGGLGSGGLGRAARVVDIRDGPLAGEKGVVARDAVSPGDAVPYAGVVVTDAELGDLLRRSPRAAARWLMYRYEFAGTSLSVLPYLGAPGACPAPYINCARGPSAKESLVVAQTLRRRPGGGGAARAPEGGARTSPRKDGAAAAAGARGERAKRWRAWGSEHIGLRLRRTVFARDGVRTLGHADGTVLAWLDAAESDFLDADGARAPLWRVRYDADGLLHCDDEDLELHELLASARAPALSAEAEAIRAATPDGRGTPPVAGATARVRANCHFAEITADDARPGASIAASVVGVFVVASRAIGRGEPLLVAYGREFWAGWAQRKARLDDLEAAADDLVAAAAAAAAASEGLADLSAAADAARFPGDAWRAIVGQPFESTRATRGAMRWRGVVVGLAENAARAGGARDYAVGERVEGYWRGAAPPWPATVERVRAGGCDLAYDDGGHEANVGFDLIRKRRTPAEWRSLSALPLGAWVRRVRRDAQRPEGAAAARPAKKPKGAPAPRQEGVVCAVRARAFDVRDDDGVLVRDCTAADWEPLLVLRYEEGHDQRVISVDQLRYLKPKFLDASTLEPPPPDGAAAAPGGQPDPHRLDLHRALLDAGIPDPRRPASIVSTEI